MVNETELDCQIQRVLRAIPSDENAPCSAFWAEIRRTDLPYIPIVLRGSPALAHRFCVRILREVGRRNIGLAYALENHLFVVGGLESYLSRRSNPRLRAIVDSIGDARQLIANSHGYVHADRAFTEGVTIASEGNDPKLSGRGSFLSLAGHADLLLLSLSGRDPAVLLLTIAGNEAVHLGELYFPTLLRDSDTRSLHFNPVALPQEVRLDLPRADIDPNGLLPGAFLCWHLSLCVAPFLGGTSWLLDEAIAFAQNFKSFDNRLLARLDGIVAEVGQAGMRIACIEAMLGEVALALGEANDRADDASFLGATVHRARVANYLGMELNEDVARRSRRILGTRIYNGSAQAIERVYAEILLGPLVPRNNSVLERDAGHALFAESAFRKA